MSMEKHLQEITKAIVAGFNEIREAEVEETEKAVMVTQLRCGIMRLAGQSLIGLSVDHVSQFTNILYTELAEQSAWNATHDLISKLKLGGQS